MLSLSSSLHLSARAISRCVFARVSPVTHPLKGLTFAHAHTHTHIVLMCGHTQILQGGLNTTVCEEEGRVSFFFVDLIRLWLAHIDLGHDG